MSGGSFNYAYMRVLDFAEELEQKLADSDYRWSPETLEELSNVLKLANYFGKVMRHTEWLYSGDYGEESFHKHLRNAFLDWARESYDKQESPSLPGKAARP